MRAMFLLSLTALFACDGDKDLGGDSGGGTDNTPPIDDPSCEADGDCSEWQICEAEECVDGDRNNAEDEALPVILDAEESVESYINTAGDEDFYTFDSDGGEFIFALIDAHEEVDEGDPKLDTFLTLYDPDGQIVTTADDFPNGGSVNNMDSALWAYLSQSGTYVLKVEDANPIKGEEAWGGRDYTYSLEVSTWGQATYGQSTFAEPFLFGDEGLELTENTLYAVGVILEGEGEVDYIALDFPYGNAGLYVDGIEDLRGSDANPMASILTMDEVLLSQRDEVGPNDGVFYPSMTEGGVMVAVEDADGGGGPNHWAVLIIKATDEDSAYASESEPNDTQVQATTIEMPESENSGGKIFYSGTIRGEFNTVGDSDFLKMEVSGEHTVETEEGDEVQYLVVCANSSRWGSSIAPDITVYDQLGTELGSASGDAGQSPNTSIENIELVPGEAVYLEVDGGEDNLGTPDEWYMLKAYIASFSVLSYDEGGYSCP